MTRVSEFQQLPRVSDASGARRRVGFEFEYAEVGVEQSAEIVADLFGGKVCADSMFKQHVETPHGTFSVEIDTSILKEKKYESLLESLGIDLAAIDTQQLEGSLLSFFSRIVPFEVVTPPLDPELLHLVDELRARLQDAGAQGTRTSLLYAFGLHINVQLPDSDPLYLRDTLRAFILLYPWLRKSREVDLSRRVAPYIDPFPGEYGLYIMREEYAPSLPVLIDDYLTFNPTRNRALDMLPCFAYLAPSEVEHREIDGQHLIKGRPAFHYRLPNCMIDEKSWRIADEWNAWVLVEQLAEDKARLREMAAEYREAENSLNPFQKSWSALVEQFL